MRPLRVAVDGRFIPGSGGGVETFVIGLAQGLESLEVDDVQICFATYQGHNEWLKQYMGRHLQLVEMPPGGRIARLRRRSRVWAVRRSAGSYATLPGRDVQMDSLEADVVHFPFQGPGWVRSPYIYHPHDLQHRHLPQFFTPREHARRELTYGTHCRRSKAIAVGTTWVKDDLVSSMNIDPRKIFVVPLAPITGERQPPIAGELPPLPNRYVIYPAVPWKHKNHEKLFLALALLRKKGLDVPVVLTGLRGKGIDLEAQALAAGVTDLVHDLQYIGQGELEHLIQGAVAMVVPTLCEAASFPIWESFRLGTPVACSTVTSLPRQVGDAAMTFDPQSVEEIATAIQTLWVDQKRGAVLAEKGRARLAEFSWTTTAQHFLALYRLLGGREISTQERDLLSKTPVI